MDEGRRGLIQVDAWRECGRGRWGGVKYFADAEAPCEEYMSDADAQNQTHRICRDDGAIVEETSVEHGCRVIIHGFFFFSARAVPHHATPASMSS